MPHYLVIGRSKPTLEALVHVLALRADTDVQADVKFRDGTLWVESADNTEADALFRQISAWIESYAAREALPLSDVVTVVDSVRPALLDPTESDSWNGSIAMLILAFPEIRWAFGNIALAELAPEQREVMQQHTLFSLFTSNPTPLFDGGGLRNLVRGCISKCKESAGSYVVTRERCAAATDEEDSYAFLHAYASYRFGYRAHCLTMFAHAEAVFGKGSTVSRVELSFEDLYLAFPDQMVAELHLSHLWAHKDGEKGESRRDRLPKLEDCKYRFLVTGAHTRASDPETWGENRKELDDWQFRRSSDGEQRRSNILGKPTSGIFDLWGKAGLGRWEKWPPKPDSATRRWPRHSAPGRLKAVAESLIQRASRLAEDAKRVSEIIKVAVLARDAMELIGHRTPTLAAEALTLVHEMEVRAECEFAGVQYHFAVAPRISDLQRETHSMANWIDPTQRETFVLNAQAAVMTRLVRVFREYGQFDEEQLCLVKLRELNRKLLVSRKPWLKPAEPLMWYLELLLRSLPHFFGAILIWLLGLTCLFFADSLRFDDLANGLSFARAYDSSWVAFQTFFSVQPPQPPAGFPMPSTGLIGFAMLAGVSHIGVFISHMYAMISRR